MTTNDQKLVQFMSFTGCDSDVARSILEGCSWDLNAATNFFFVEEPAKNPSEKTISSPKKQPPPKPIHKTSESKNEPLVKIHSESNILPERVKALGSHDKFSQYRFDAKNKNRWLLVLLTEKPLDTSILNNVSLRDFTHTRYVPLEINLEETDGQWFSSSYNCKKLPYYAILDPETAELVEKREGTMTLSKTQIFLRSFLNEHPEKGRPIDLELGDLYNSTLSFSSDQSESNSENEAEVEKPEKVEDLGEMVKIMLQLPNRKKTKIDIGENDTIQTLYKKTGSLLRKSLDSFKLFIPYPKKELDDTSKTIKEMDLKNSMICIEDVV